VICAAEFPFSSNWPGRSVVRIANLNSYCCAESLRGLLICRHRDLDLLHWLRMFFLWLSSSAGAASLSVSYRSASSRARAERGVLGWYCNTCFSGDGKAIAPEAILKTESP